MSADILVLTPLIRLYPRVAGWDGRPIAFGTSVSYVCARGTLFEHDPAVEEVTYQCMDGGGGGKRGFLNTPSTEQEWPVCKHGEN